MRPVLQRPKGQPNRLRSVHLPAPIGGVNTVSPGTDMPKTDSIYSYNLIGAELGLRTRLGWREYVTGLDGEVRSLLPFTGSTKDGSASRLFACTSTGIWDCTASTVTPTRVFTFGTQNQDSGWGASTVMVTAGGHFLVYTDEANGLFVYQETDGTWTAGGIAGVPVTGADPTKLVNVVAWKNRLWFTERDSARGWYLGINAVSGAATSFNFGGRFKAGGDLRGLWSWTYDGGSGIDDALVAVSGGGDVVIYKGTDPASATTFGLVGVWFVGAVPVGRRLCTDFGGDLLVMSSLGILPLSKLVTGNILYERSQYQTAKIANLFQQAQAATSTVRGWAMRLHPADACLMVLIPTGAGAPSNQFVMSLATRGWHVYRDLPIGPCAEPWNGTLFFGTADGRVCVNDGYLDGVTLADPNSYSPIQWSLLSAFSNLGSTNQKRVSLIRPRVLSQGGAVPFQAAARYGLDLSELLTAPASSSAAGSVWNVAKWDSAVWGGTYQANAQVWGATGYGIEVAVAVRGTANSRMTLVGIDVSLDVGGLL